MLQTLNPSLCSPDVVGRGSNFLNDIVLDYVNGAVRYAYVTDVGGVQIVVFDFLSKVSLKGTFKY